MKLGKLWIFGTPPKIWNISLKHLKLPKNHFKTNLFYLQLRYLKCALTFGKKMKIWPPTLLSNSPHFELWTFLFLGLPPPLLLNFSHFLWHFLTWMHPLLFYCFTPYLCHFMLDFDCIKVKIGIYSKFKNPNRFWAKKSIKNCPIIIPWNYVSKQIFPRQILPGEMSPG